MSTPHYTGRHRMEAPHGDSLNKALRHKDALFSMAQILTQDHERAIQLVEKTYVRALNGPAINQIDLQDRRYMLQLLIELHKEQSRITPSLFALEQPNPEESAAKVSTSIKEQLIQDALKDIMPLAFASLDDSDRILLILCEVEQLSCADASLILGSDSELICDRLEYAKSRLKTLVIQNTSPMLAQVLTSNDSTNWLSTSLHHSLKHTYKTPPNKLESRIRGAFPHRKEKRPAASYAHSRRADRDIQSPHSIGNRTVRLVIMLVLIISAGLAGYIGSEVLQTQPDPNLVSLSARQAKRIKPILTTSNPEEAQDFIINHLDWRLTLPKIDGSTIKGVGISEIVQGVRVPVFLYEGTQEEDTALTIYVFTYAILDQFQSQIELSQETLTAITDQAHIDKYELSSGNNVFIWRNADDIFLAVAPEVELRNRIQIQ